MSSERIEWLKWRKEGIGSSDAPIIMGVSPWKTRYQLWEEKISPEVKEDSSNQYIKDKGNRMEAKVRAHFELVSGFQSFPAHLVQSEELPWLKASLDGRAPDGKDIIEIKLSGKDDFNNAKDAYGRTERERVPEKYWPQVQHALMVSGAEVCHFLSYYDKEGDEQIREQNLALVHVHLDEKYRDELMAKEAAFWELLKSKKPPELCERDYKTVKGFAKQAAKYRRLKLKAKAIDNELKGLKADILAAAEGVKHPRLMFGGLHVNQITKQGAVDFKAVLADAQHNFFAACTHLTTEQREQLAPGLKNIENHDAYRKSASIYWEIDL